MMPPNTPATTTPRNASRNAERERSVGGSRSGPSSSVEGSGAGSSTAGDATAGDRRSTMRPVGSPPMRALVVLPTYNEIENIEAVLRQTRASLPDGAVLVVDDGSPDGTADRAEALGVELGCISVLRRPAKAGLGSAYRAGFRRGLDEGYEALIEMDADLSHDP